MNKLKYPLIKINKFIVNSRFSTNFKFPLKNRYFNNHFISEQPTDQQAESTQRIFQQRQGDNNVVVAPQLGNVSLTIFGKSDKNFLLKKSTEPFKN